MNPFEGQAVNLRIDPLDPATEAEIVHGWAVEERARFWMMQDHTLEEVREIYTWIDEQDTHAAYLVRHDGDPVALFQTYQPQAEEVGGLYDVEPGDVGVHFMFGPTRHPLPGFTELVMTLLMDRIFSDDDVQRVLAEPDARNDKAVALAQRIGFRGDRVVELSTKPARLLFLTRATYASRFSKNASA